MAGEAEEPDVIDVTEGDDAPEIKDDAANTDSASEGADEAPDPVAAAAVKAGWKPKDKWKGDATNWTDAGDYLANLASQNKSLKDQVKRTASVAERAIEKNRREAIAEAHRRIAEAAETGDSDAALEAAKDLEKATTIGSTPRDEFKSRNDWFDSDPIATNIAVAAAQKVADQGGTTKEQFDAAEAEVRKRCPELFDDAAPEVRPSRSAPLVQQGSRTPAPPRKKGWADMPANARDQNEKAFVRKGLMTRDEIADAYWQENG